VAAGGAVVAAGGAVVAAGGAVVAAGGAVVAAGGAVVAAGGAVVAAGGAVVAAGGAVVAAGGAVVAAGGAVVAAGGVSATVLAGPAVVPATVGAEGSKHCIVDGLYCNPVIHPVASQFPAWFALHLLQPAPQGLHDFVAASNPKPSLQKSESHWPLFVLQNVH